MPIVNGGGGIYTLTAKDVAVDGFWSINAASGRPGVPLSH
jgi:hypothetical protein